MFLSTLTWWNIPLNLVFKSGLWLNSSFYCRRNTHLILICVGLIRHAYLLLNGYSAKFPIRVEYFDQFWIDRCRAYHKNVLHWNSAVWWEQYISRNASRLRYYSFKTPYVRWASSSVFNHLQRTRSDSDLNANRVLPNLTRRLLLAVCALRVFGYQHSAAPTRKHSGACLTEAWFFSNSSIVPN